MLNHLAPVSGTIALLIAVVVTVAFDLLGLIPKAEEEDVDPSDVGGDWGGPPRGR